MVSKRVIASKVILELWRTINFSISLLVAKLVTKSNSNFMYFYFFSLYTVMMSIFSANLTKLVQNSSTRIIEEHPGIIDIFPKAFRRCL